MQSESHVIINRSYDSYDPIIHTILSVGSCYPGSESMIQDHFSLNGYAVKVLYKKSVVSTYKTEIRWVTNFLQFWDRPSEKCFSELLCLDLNNIHNSKKVI